MLKLKNAKNLDARLAMLVDHAYLCVKPPAGGATRAKQRPPEQRYVEMLLMQRLDRRTTPQVLKKLRRLQWPACQPWVAKLLRKAAVKGRFSAQEHLASLTAALGRYHPGLPVLLADEVLERVRLGLELPDRGMQTRGRGLCLDAVEATITMQAHIKNAWRTLRCSPSCTTMAWWMVARCLIRSTCCCPSGMRMRPEWRPWTP